MPEATVTAPPPAAPAAGSPPSAPPEAPAVQPPVAEGAYLGEEPTNEEIQSVAVPEEPSYGEEPSIAQPPEGAEGPKAPEAGEMKPPEAPAETPLDLDGLWAKLETLEPQFPQEGIQATAEATKPPWRRDWIPEPTVLTDPQTGKVQMDCLLPREDGTTEQVHIEAANVTEGFQKLHKAMLEARRFSYDAKYAAVKPAVPEAAVAPPPAPAQAPPTPTPAMPPGQPIQSAVENPWNLEAAWKKDAEEVAKIELDPTVQQMLAPFAMEIHNDENLSPRQKGDKIQAEYDAIMKRELAGPIGQRKVRKEILGSRAEFYENLANCDLETQEILPNEYPNLMQSAGDMPDHLIRRGGKPRTTEEELVLRLAQNPRARVAIIADWRKQKARLKEAEIKGYKNGWNQAKQTLQTEFHKLRTGNSGAPPAGLTPDQRTVAESRVTPVQQPQPQPWKGQPPLPPHISAESPYDQQRRYRDSIRQRTEKRGAP